MFLNKKGMILSIKPLKFSTGDPNEIRTRECRLERAMS